MFAALTTVEPPIVEREAAMILEQEESWYGQRQRLLDDRARERLDELANYLGDREWLDGSFSAGDLLMVTVLRRLEPENSPDGPPLLGEFPNLCDYVARGKDRPAFQRAFEAQRAVYEASRSASNSAA